MAVTRDRVGELLDGGIRFEQRILVTPEGVPLSIRVAGNGERFGAFVLDLSIILVTMVAMYVLALFSFGAYGYGFWDKTGQVGVTVFVFLAFLIRILYFIHFEIAWQGRTPGKRICGLRVVNRHGGELTPTAIIARNLTREVEVFFPLSAVMIMGFSDHAWQNVAVFLWSLIFPALPLFNRARLRAGDMIAGTQVISMPKRVLLDDLVQPGSEAQQEHPTARFTFTHEQLARYGAFELQVLEELLRRRPSKENNKILIEVCEKIRRKICWDTPIPPQDVRVFLTDFYAAERADLEQGQLFGRLREDKTAAEKRGIGGSVKR